MKFENPANMVKRAQEKGYAIPALNTNGGSYDIARAALEAAEETKAPVIVQSYEPNCAYRGFGYIANTTAFLADELDISVPVALQVDHGHSFDSVVSAMRAGFSSVMFDASHEPLEDNIALTNQVLQVANALNVAVEAEVGHVKGNEPKPEKQIGRIPVPESPSIPPTKTDPKEAKAFVEACNVTMLAVSVGTTHGVYQNQDKIDFELLKELQSTVDVPLVQHGTSGISLDNLSKLAKSGMSKINFGEPFRFEYIQHFNDLTESMEHLWHPWRIQKEIKNRLKDKMVEIIKALGADGKAG